MESTTSTVIPDVISDVISDVNLVVMSTVVPDVIPVWYSCEEKLVSGLSSSTRSDDVILAVLVSAGYALKKVDLRRYVLMECCGNTKHPLAHSDRILCHWNSWDHLKDRVYYAVVRQRGTTTRCPCQCQRRRQQPGPAEEPHVEQDSIGTMLQPSHVEVLVPQRRLPELQVLYRVIYEKQRAIKQEKLHLRQLKSIARFYEQQLCVSSRSPMYLSMSTMMPSKYPKKKVHFDEEQNRTYEIESTEGSVEPRRNSKVFNMFYKQLQNNRNKLFGCVSKKS